MRLVLSTGAHSMTLGPGAERDRLTAAGRWREMTKPLERPLTAPAPTVDAKAAGAWAIHPPGERRERLADGTAVRPAIEDTAVLQTFPADYPWQGTKSSRQLQVGNAVPPLLARAVVTAAAGLHHHTT